MLSRIKISLKILRIKIMRYTRNVTALIEESDSYSLKNEKVRKAVKTSLVQIGDAAVEPLIAGLRAGPGLFSGYELAITVLGQIKDIRAVEPLIAEFERDEDGYRIAGLARALGEIGDARAVEPLIAQLKRNDEILASSKIKDARPWSAAIDGIAEALGRLGDTRAIEPLSHKLEASYGSIRDEVVDAFVRIGDPRAVDPLIDKFLNSHQKLSRQKLAKSLVSLYQTGNLSEMDRAKILGHRAQIISPHSDYYDHDDKLLGSTCSSSGHVDEAAGSHSDKGIGVEFPL